MDVGSFERPFQERLIQPVILNGRYLPWLANRMSEPRGVDERSFCFLCDIIRFVRTIAPEPGVRRLVDQLVASAGSIAAHRQEATGASSRREFIRLDEIALRSAKETVLWLRAFTVSGIGDRGAAPVLLGEAEQLARIIAAIVIRAKENRMGD